MRVITLEILYLTLVFWSRAAATDISSCETTISMQCSIISRRIAIKSINVTSNLARSLLEQCNTKNQCHVANKKNECIHAQYLCRKATTTLHIVSSSTAQMTTADQTLSLMSEGYAKGQANDAQNVTCHLQFNDHEANAETKITISILEFATLPTSEELCLSIESSNERPVCSGSRKFHSSLGPYLNRHGLKFSLTLANTAKYLPKVRFWIDITVSEEQEKSLECSSYPVIILQETTEEPKATSETYTQLNARTRVGGLANGSIIAIVLALLFVLTVVVLAIVTVFMCRQRNALKIIAPESSAIEDGNYDYIVTYSQYGSREENPPPLPSARTQTGSASNSLLRKSDVDFRSYDGKPTEPRDVLHDIIQREKSETVSQAMFDEAIRKVKCEGEHASPLLLVEPLQKARSIPRVIVDTANYSHVPRELQVHVYPEVKIVQHGDRSGQNNAETTSGDLKNVSERNDLRCAESAAGGLQAETTRTSVREAVCSDYLQLIEGDSQQQINRERQNSARLQGLSAGGMESGMNDNNENDNNEVPQAMNTRRDSPHYKSLYAGENITGIDNDEKQNAYMGLQNRERTELMKVGDIKPGIMKNLLGNLEDPGVEHDSSQTFVSPSNARECICVSVNSDISASRASKDHDEITPMEYLDLGSG